MKITLNRRTCNCWDAPCESHFGSHFLGETITPIDCVVEMVDDGKTDLTFYILDRDGQDKILVIDESNRGDAWNSWIKAWEKQNKAA